MWEIVSVGSVELAMWWITFELEFVFWGSDRWLGLSSSVGACGERGDWIACSGGRDRVVRCVWDGG
jgi:hypothetical protein